LRGSDPRTVCAWKSSRSYNGVVDGLVSKDAAKHIDGSVALWKGLSVA